MKLLSIVFALSFLSMTEGANLRSVHKQAPVSKGKESPIEGSLRQILDDNNDAAWNDRELKKKSVKAKKKKGDKDKKKKKQKKKKQKKKAKKSKKKSNKGLNKKQKRNCKRNPTNYSYCPVLVTATAAVYVVPDTPSGRKLQTNESNLSVAAMGALAITIRNLLEDEGFEVDSVTIISITVDYLVTYDAVLSLPQGTSEAQAQSIVDGALTGITQEEFQDELQDNLIGLDCGIDCSDLGNATKTVSTLSPTSSPSVSPSKAPTGAPSKAPTSSPSSSPTTSAPTPEVSEEDDLTPSPSSTASPSPSGTNSASPSPSPDPLTPSPSTDPLTPSPSVDTLIESTADIEEVIPWETDRYLV